MVRAVGTMVNSGSSVDYPGTTTAVRLKYRGEEVTYTISSAEIELFLEDYASSNNGVKKRSTGTVKEVERFVWQFFEFVRTGRLIKGTNRGRSRTAIKAPEEDVEYHITRRELERYVTVILSEYSSASAAKRLKIVKRFLREIGIPVQYLGILDNGIRLTERAKKKEQEFKTPILTIEDGREVFKRLERLYDLGAISYCQYIKAISFVLVEFATGLRVSEIARLKAEHVDFENHRIVLSTQLTKEGKLLNLKGGNKVVFLTREAETALKFYINECRDKITSQDGYLFVTNAPTVLDGETKTTLFIHKIIQKSKKYEAFEANLDFPLLESPDIRFKMSFGRKLFIQVWQSRAEKLGVDGYLADAISRKLTGHAPPSDVHKLHYQNISRTKMWEYYNKIYYNVSFLTERQKELLGLSRPKRSRGSNFPFFGGAYALAPFHGYTQERALPMNPVEAPLAWN